MRAQNLKKKIENNCRKVQKGKETWLGWNIETSTKKKALKTKTLQPFQSLWLCWGLTTRQPLWVILCRLPEKGREETEEIVEEMKERDMEETEEIKKFLLYPYLLRGQQALPNCKPVSVGRPGDVRYTTSPHHPPPPPPPPFNHYW